MASSNNLDALSQDGRAPLRPTQGAGSTPLRKALSLRPWWTRERSWTTRRTKTGARGSLRPRGPPPVRLREHNRGLHRRPGPGVRMPRLSGAGGRGPRREQRALGELPPLPAGDLHPERRGVTAFVLRKRPGNFLRALPLPCTIKFIYRAYKSCGLEGLVRGWPR